MPVAPTSLRIIPPTTCNEAPDVVVPIPTLLPDTEIGELPKIALPLYAGIVPTVPSLLFVTAVCAAALIAKAAMQNVNPIICLCMVLLVPSFWEAKSTL
jgi:hypothetical protein